MQYKQLKHQVILKHIYYHITLPGSQVDMWYTIPSEGQSLHIHSTKENVWDSYHWVYIVIHLLKCLSVLYIKKNKCDHQRGQWMIVFIVNQLQIIKNNINTKQKISRKND